MLISVQVDERELGTIARRLLGEFSAAGVAIGARDLDRLQTADRAIGEDGGGPPLAVLADQPVWAGNIALWRPSLGASCYLDELDRLLAGEDELQIVAAAYVCAYGRQPEALAALDSPERAQAAVQAWMRTIRCTADELFGCVEAALSGFPAAGPRGSGATIEPATGALATAAMLAESAGAGVRYWLWDVSEQMARWVVRSRETASAILDGELPPARQAAMQRVQDLRRELRQKYGLGANG